MKSFYFMTNSNDHVLPQSTKELHLISSAFETVQPRHQRLILVTKFSENKVTKN